MSNSILTHIVNTVKTRLKLGTLNSSMESMTSLEDFRDEVLEEMDLCLCSLFSIC